MGRADEPVALYIHWPFCVAKCPYCDFNSHVRASVDVAGWQAALLADMAHEAELTRGRTIGSIFFGGGTPSLMPPALVATLIDAAARHWTLAPAIEITLEANPSSVETANFGALAACGVNRVSLGVQALDDETLRFLGRAHDVGEALSAIEVAQRAFARTSFDLIYARPGQSERDWQAELARALAFGTTHLSLYQLTIEPGTQFATLVRTGALDPLDDDAAADLYAMTGEMTSAAGLPAYEISNHAAPGQEGRHNLTYWRYGDYVGIGPGAHGRRNGAATQRHRKPENFLSGFARNGNGIVSEVALDPATRATEALLVGLRLAEGVDLDRVAQQSGIDAAALVDDRAVGRLAALGLVGRTGNRIALTPAGFPVLDAILPELLAIEASAAA